MQKIIKSDAQWKAELDPFLYHVAREKGTEPAFTGALYNHKAKGKYLCSCCQAPLFSSDAKFDSGTGWPSFYEPISKEAVSEHQDSSYGMVRTEVVCSSCEAHLGHVFPDGPPPTHQRYCINSVSLVFVQE